MILLFIFPNFWYMDGEQLTVADEKVLVERLLRYHPKSEDKIECGLDSIMVDRHPEFRHSRCLYVVRTDGGWIDFSYQKCLRAYIRDKYPSHAERFISEHFQNERFYGKLARMMSESP
ncbi:protein DCL homolog, chloroplastic-like [Hibiscus syriacus]|uniref:protein DCL homolog, chloroplastic-like n=1 Tax=Hibiscus syriacus TaxID=106335 RepID=UPI001920F51F|nr:protein DCL homolog, chloroplastic-like [Hibiscus syriacus]